MKLETDEKSGEEVWTADYEDLSDTQLLLLVAARVVVSLNDGRSSGLSGELEGRAWEEAKAEAESRTASYRRHAEAAAKSAHRPTRRKASARRA